MVSRGINKVILIGNLGQDPEVRYLSNGGTVTNIALATSESWKDKQTGESKEQTEWHRVVLFGKLAELASEYLRKGSQVYIEGQLRTRKWTDHAGQDRYITEIIVNNINGTMQMLGNRHMNIAVGTLTTTNSSNDNNPLHNDNIQQSRVHKKSTLLPSNEPSIDFDDDIPF